MFYFRQCGPHTMIQYRLKQNRTTRETQTGTLHVRDVCMYVRIYIFMFAQNLTAYTGYTVTEALWKCIIVLEETRQILVERRTVTVIATGHELSVEVSSKEPDRNRRKFFVHIALSYSTKWRDCLALLNAGDSVWQLLRQGCITRRVWVLTDVNTCIRARTSCTLSSVELSASAGGRE